MANLNLKNIKKIYGRDVTAVHDFTLDIEDREFIVLVGPSGCGKSTTLRMIAGLEEISAGDLIIGDKRVNELSPKDRNIAMVFQNYALYPHMTVYENLAFSLTLRHMDKKEIEKKVLQAAEILSIAELLKRKPKELSGGQRQRVAIGRAIVREPAVFLMDEPLSNLDAKLRNQMRAEILKLHKSINTTFVYVTHDQTEAMTLGDRIVVMKDGYIQQIGTPQQVFNHPANLFVASFIGTPQMNFLDVELKRERDEYYAVLNDKKIALGAEMNAKLLKKNIDDCDVALGIRPEHMKISSAPQPGSIQADVDVSELMGSEIFLHLNALGKEIIVRVPTVELDELCGKKIRNCEDVEIMFPIELAHLFSKEDEASLLG